MNFQLKFTLLFLMLGTIFITSCTQDELISEDMIAQDDVSLKENLQKDLTLNNDELLGQQQKDMERDKKLMNKLLSELDISSRQRTSGCQPIYPSPNGSSSAMLQNEINNLVGTGLPLCLAAQEYFIDATIFANGVSICGNGATFKLMDGVNVDTRMLVYASANNFFIRDLTFDGNRYATTNNGYGYPLAIYSSSNMLIEGCSFVEVERTAVRLQNCINSFMFSNKFIGIGPCTSGPTESCSGGHWDAIFITRDTETRNIFITESEFTDIGYHNPGEATSTDADGIQLLVSDPNAIMERIYILSNSFTNIGRRCVKIQSGDYISIKNNTTDNCNIFVGDILAYNSHDQNINWNQISNTAAFMQFATFLPNIEASVLKVVGNTFDNTGYANSSTSSSVFGSNMSIKDSYFLNNSAINMGSQIWSGGFLTTSNINFSKNTFEYTPVNHAMNIADPVDWNYTIGGANTCTLIHLNNNSNSVGNNLVKYNFINGNTFEERQNSCNNWFVYQNVIDPTNQIIF